jgi:dTDP-4-dehydrorhamnose reductase
MRLLITGAAGMLGLDVHAAALADGHEPISLARAELDIADAEVVTATLQEYQPDAVINCAAYTKVDDAESDLDAAHAINGVGAGNVAAAAAAVGAWTIHVSSDYVFDGTKTSPYLESYPTAPASVYGASKLAGEQAVAAAAPDAHTIVRSSWLFGAGGPCFPATMLRLARDHDELNVVEDQIGCPTFTGHLAQALVGLAESAAAPSGGTVQPPLGILHVAAAGECSWFEFARETLESVGSETVVKPCSTDEFPRPARRPAYSVMRSERGAPILPSWEDGLDAYLRAIEEEIT